MSNHVVCKHCGKAVLVQVNFRDIEKALHAFACGEISTARLGEILEMWANNRDISKELDF